MNVSNSDRFIQCKGFSLLELIIVISIAMILGAISLTTFFSVSENQSLEKDVNYAIALVEKARLQTVNAKENAQFSVRFASSSVVLYQGATYSTSSPTNTTFTFSPKVEISSINLTGNSQSVSFEKITGKSNATGTIKFRLKTNTNASTTVILYKTGLVETQ
ncbi:MAG: prepilin-type N-terminal cleavage/methylation domain-containing protein [Candidatus Pacebacteria bacterium]|nr:prepilin-type N-terminal cleavage/methylation domain-containing protein [Candidatus Paceibacterota bacterium]MBP9818365.1 prepilin-type N-terminal cleavage/methylation domain-containing protein [Candidatus Paceibacterota bacterium]